MIRTISFAALAVCVLCGCGGSSWYRPDDGYNRRHDHHWRPYRDDDPDDDDSDDPEPEKTAQIDPSIAKLTDTVAKLSQSTVDLQRSMAEKRAPKADPVEMLPARLPSTSAASPAPDEPAAQASFFAPPKYGGYTGAILWGDRKNCQPCIQEQDDVAQAAKEAGLTFGESPNSDFWVRRPTAEMIAANKPMPFIEFVENGRVTSTKEGYQRNGADLAAIMALHPKSRKQGPADRSGDQSNGEPPGAPPADARWNDQNSDWNDRGRRKSEYTGSPMPYMNRNVAAWKDGFVGLDGKWHDWDDVNTSPIATFATAEGSKNARRRALDLGISYSIQTSSGCSQPQYSAPACSQPAYSYSAPNCSGGGGGYSYSQPITNYVSSPVNYGFSGGGFYSGGRQRFCVNGICY